MASFQRDAIPFLLYVMHLKYAKLYRTSSFHFFTSVQVTVENLLKLLITAVRSRRRRATDDVLLKIWR